MMSEVTLLCVRSLELWFSASSSHFELFNLSSPIFSLKTNLLRPTPGRQTRGRETKAVNFIGISIFFTQFDTDLT